MDALRESDLEIARTTSPGEKFRQALEMMEAGIALQRRKLRAEHPDASEARIDELLLGLDGCSAVSLEEALVDVAQRLRQRGIRFALVGAATTTSVLPSIPVATAEHLLAMKILSMRSARLQDQIDARSLLGTGAVDMDEVYRMLDLIVARGYARQQDLRSKLASLLAADGA